MFNHSNAALSQLVELVTSWKVEGAREILKKDPSYALVKLTFVDNPANPSEGRKFENVSILQYALWTLDKAMWQMILFNTLNPNQTFLTTAKAQMKELEREGLVYFYKGSAYKEKHFNFINASGWFENYENNLRSDDVSKSLMLSLMAESTKEKFDTAYKILPEHFKLLLILDDKDPESIASSRKRFERVATDALSALYDMGINLVDDPTLHADNIPKLSNTLKNEDGGCAKGCSIL